MEGGDLTTWVDPERNADVMTGLDVQRPSCHSDAGDALHAASHCVAHLAFRPSFDQCGHVAVIADGIRAAHAAVGS